MLRILNSNGVTIEEYYWYTDDGYFGTGSGFEPGWYTESEELVSTINIGRGVGLYIYISHYEGVNLQTAGSVVKDETTVSLLQGVNVTGNATPIALNLQCVKLDSNAGGDGTEMLRILNNNGVTTEEYYWYTEQGYFGEGSGFNPGWYTEGEELVENITLEPGEGMYIYKSTSADVKLILPNPLSASK